MLTVRAGDSLGIPARDRGLARRDLTLSRLEHVAHDVYSTCSGATPRALEGRADGDGAQVDRPQAGERTRNLPIGVRAPATITERSVMERV